MIKKCAWCRQYFKPENWAIKYCSDECRKNARRKYLQEYRKKFQKQKKKYPCSIYRYEYLIPTKLCLNCNSERCRFDNNISRKKPVST